MSIDPQFLLSSYHFDLPEEQIAQLPPEKRGQSRLMVLNRHTGHCQCTDFSHILEFLPQNCLLVANNSKVIPARIRGKRPTGGQVEFLLLTPLPLLQTHQGENGWSFATAEGLLRSSKKVQPGEKVHFTNNFWLEVQVRGDFGKCTVVMHWNGNLEQVLLEGGELPLPPYIKRQQSEASPQVKAMDMERYQTVYSREDKAGSVAAPTAGLHFSKELQEKLLASGREWAEVTLYVGYGTFSPVRCDDIREHEMHPEYVELSQQTAEKIAKAKAEGRPVIAVGTTSARTLEGLALMQAAQGQSCPTPSAHSGWINIFLYPGKNFQVIDGLLTNFHLPESTLLMLVSAFAGRENTLQAYETAVKNGFRFFSYGDAMLIV